MSNNLQDRTVPPAGVPSIPDDAVAVATAAGSDVLTGHLDGMDDEGRLLFRADGADVAHPVAIAVHLSDDELARAAHLGRRAVVIRTSASREGALIGLLRERVGAAARDAALGAGVNVSVDGEAVRITAQTEIELRCGKSRLLLHKDGRVEISGNYLISRSRGPVKIKGATIALN